MGPSLWITTLNHAVVAYIFSDYEFCGKNIWSIPTMLVAVGGYSDHPYIDANIFPILVTDAIHDLGTNGGDILNANNFPGYFESYE